jgi:signal peptidase I
MSSGLIDHAPSDQASAPPGPVPGSRRLLTGITWGCLLLVLLAVLGLGLLMASGYRMLVIRSGSMTPALHTGDLVLSRSQPVGSLQPGDVATFHAPALGGQLVTHRVRSIAVSGNVITVSTRGDGNKVGENWSASADDHVGVAVGRMRYVGWWFALLQTGIGRAVLIVLASLWVAVVSVVRIWARV